MLFRKIRSELPKLIEEIEENAASSREQIGQLGPSRNKPEQQKEFLIAKSQLFHAICSDALIGDYENEFFSFDPDNRKNLCAIIMTSHEPFADTLRISGCYWKTKVYIRGLLPYENASRLENIQPEVEAIKEALDC